MTPPTPPRYLLDTNVVLHLARRQSVGQWIAAHYDLTTASVPLICVVTDGELRSLVLRLGWGAPRLSALRAALAHAAVVPLDFPGLLDAYARLDVFSQGKGRKMGKNDLWIAAAAHVTGARLLTTDQDFDVLHGSQIQRDYIDINAI